VVVKSAPVVATMMTFIFTIERHLSVDKVITLVEVMVIRKI